MTDSDIPPPPGSTPPPADHSPWAPQQASQPDGTPASPTPASPTPASPTPASPTPASNPYQAPTPWTPSSPPSWAIPPGASPVGTSPVGTSPVGTSPVGTSPVGTSPVEETLFPLQPERRRRRGLVTSLVTVVVLVVGAVITYVAVSDASSGGASSPQQAVRNALSDLHNGDVIGLLNDLPSGERAAISGPLQRNIASLKRLGALSSKADLHKVSGITFTAAGVTFAKKPVVINDHVQIVTLTGGTVTANADALKLPLTAHMLAVTHASSAHPTSQSQNLAKVPGGVRIATEKVSGGWYVSIFYTAADSAADKVVPTPSDYIAPAGATSATAAVRSAVTALLGGRLRAALALVSPAELGAVHDYGGLILDSASDFPDSGVHLTTLDLASSTLSDGTVKVSLTKVAFTTPSGENISVASKGKCYTTTINGHTTKECAADAITQAEGVLGVFACGFSSSGGGFADSSGDSGTFGWVPDPGADSGSGASSGSGDDGISIDPGYGGDCTPPTLTAAQKKAFTDLLDGPLGGGLGVITEKVNGSWYLAPVRTLTEFGAQTLGSLQGNDLFALISLGSDH
ncbi:hypothetical protein [Jatrophihabitans sp.]|uniref:hypothetical protein n=1 Tax=Jatrophihabitans sp. TaxID=1932789 RepID=UPI0030C6CB06|nr:Flagellar basal body-associated protein FliL [Jatrophihabitans sp.]